MLQEENGVKVARKAELSQDERDSKRQRQDNDGDSSPMHVSLEPP